jgi:hypothetical protein
LSKLYSDVRRLFRSNDERLGSLPVWVDAYDRRRPHAGLDGQTTMSVLINNVVENDNYVVAEGPIGRPRAYGRFQHTPHL